MLRLLRYALLILLLLAGATAAATYLVLQNPNDLKPQIEALIATRTGVPVRIDGDLHWRLWPPVSLRAASLHADHRGQAWQVGALSLDVDARTLLADPAGWRIQSLTLNDVSMLENGNQLTIDRASLADLVPRQPAPLSAELSYAPAGQAPIPLTVDGMVQIDPDTLTLRLDDTRLSTTSAQGVCNVEARPVADPEPALPAHADDLLPVDLLRSYRWNGACLLDWIVLRDRRFEQVTVTIENDAGDSRTRLEAPQFFGGEAELDWHVDARATPLRWRVTPTLSGVDSQALLLWLDQQLQWAAPLAYGGELTFSGNHPQALLASASGETRFDGGTGTIDIAMIKARLLELADQFNERERIARWPDVWAYQRMVGDWRIDGARHELDLALDNLAVTAAGDYDPADDALDMAVELTFGDDPDLPIFELNPLLYDLPIPLRCRGSLAEPDCRLDGDAARRIVAQALAGGENNAMRATLEQKIDEQVPEQYRDAARALLEMLSGGSQSPDGE
jgi:hypothetical protein